MIDHCFGNFDLILSNYKIEKIKTIGDSYMCASGLPKAEDHSPVDVIMVASHELLAASSGGVWRKTPSLPA